MCIIEVLLLWFRTHVVGNDDVWLEGKDRRKRKNKAPRVVEKWGFSAQCVTGGHSLPFLGEAVRRIKRAVWSFLYFWIFRKVAVTKHLQDGRVRHRSGTPLSGYKWKERGDRRQAMLRFVAYRDWSRRLLREIYDETVLFQLALLKSVDRSSLGQLPLASRGGMRYLRTHRCSSVCMFTHPVFLIFQGELLTQSELTNIILVENKKKRQMKKGQGNGYEVEVISRFTVQ